MFEGLFQTLKATTWHINAELFHNLKRISTIFLKSTFSLFAFLLFLFLSFLSLLQRSNLLYNWLLFHTFIQSLPFRFLNLYPIKKFVTSNKIDYGIKVNSCKKYVDLNL